MSFAGGLTTKIMGLFLIAWWGIWYYLADKTKNTDLFGEIMEKEYISNSIEMARHIAYLCKEHKYEYNNTKIQKLMYACYGVVLVCTKKKLFNESPRAWPYGPVFPNAFNYINNNNIDYALEKNDLSNNIANLLDKVVKAFGSYRASVLSAWSHKKDSPWDVVIHKMESKWGTLIPDEIIEKYFKDNVVKI